MTITPTPPQGGTSAAKPANTLKTCLVVGLVLVGFGIAVYAAQSALASLAPKTTPDISAIYTQAVQTAFAGMPRAAAPSTIVEIPANPSIPPTTKPSPTADPNLVEPGTHIVGKDMKPGLYRGQAGTDTCYWKRLKDVSGSFESILANDNSEGQFYVRVKDTDYALQTDCELTLLSPLPGPSAQMPTSLVPGTYLVGIDMQPGTYEGQAGTDTCYWKRLRDVEGGFGSIIANDNAGGQFYVQVSPSDFAFTTACPVQRVGN